MFHDLIEEEKKVEQEALNLLRGLFIKQKVRVLWVPPPNETPDGPKGLKWYEGTVTKLRRNPNGSVSQKVVYDDGYVKWHNPHTEEGFVFVE